MNGPEQRPERMPVFRSQDKIRVHWLTALCAFDLLYGGVRIFGRTESVSQEYLRGIGLPPPFWGALIVIAAGLIWWGWSVPGARVAGFAWAALAGASLMTITDAVSYGGPILFGYAAYQHALISHDVGSGLDTSRQPPPPGVPGYYINPITPTQVFRQEGTPTGFVDVCPAVTSGGTWTVQHNLGTKFLLVQIAATATPFAYVTTWAIGRTDLNTLSVTVGSTIAAGDYEIMIRSVL